MLLRMQTPQMMPNTSAGKNMNVTTTDANSVVAISTNINTGIVSPLADHSGTVLVSGHPSLERNYYQFTPSSLLALYAVGLLKNSNVHISITRIAL